MSYRAVLDTYEARLNCSLKVPTPQQLKLSRGSARRVVFLERATATSLDSRAADRRVPYINLSALDSRSILHTDLLGNGALLNTIVIGLDATVLDPSLSNARDIKISASAGHPRYANGVSYAASRAAALLATYRSFVCRVHEPMARITNFNAASPRFSFETGIARRVGHLLRRSAVIHARTGHRCRR